MKTLVRDVSGILMQDPEVDGRNRVDQVVYESRLGDTKTSSLTFEQVKANSKK